MGRDREPVSGREELNGDVVSLRDGSHALIRPIQPDDKERLRDGLERLSARSRYLRFHTPVTRLTEAQLRFFTEIDYHDHMAWGALDADDPEMPGIGVARYIRLQDEPTIAEAAITVVDSHQGKGLGSILLRYLIRSAQENGIDTFRNYVLAHNRAMLDVFEALGAQRVLEEQGVYRVDLPLPSWPG